MPEAANDTASKPISRQSSQSTLVNIDKQFHATNAADEGWLKQVCALSSAGLGICLAMTTNLTITIWTAFACWAWALTVMLAVASYFLLSSLNKRFQFYRNQIDLLQIQIDAITPSATPDLKAISDSIQSYEKSRTTLKHSQRCFDGLKSLALFSFALALICVAIDVSLRL